MRVRANLHVRQGLERGDREHIGYQEIVKRAPAGEGGNIWLRDLRIEPVQYPRLRQCLGRA
eukprot:6448801-Pyramimonas_sp.AAC.1